VLVLPPDFYLPFSAFRGYSPQIHLQLDNPKLVYFKEDSP
jgi:hypothetical protein